MKNERQRARSLSTSQLWKEVESRAPYPVGFIILCYIFIVPHIRDRNYWALGVSILILAILARFLENRARNVLTELKSRVENREQDAGQVSSEGAPSTPPDEPSA